MPHHNPSPGPTNGAGYESPSFPTQVPAPAWTVVQEVPRPASCDVSVVGLS